MDDPPAWNEREEQILENLWFFTTQFPISVDVSKWIQTTGFYSFYSPYVVVKYLLRFLEAVSLAGMSYSFNIFPVGLQPTVKN